VAVTIGLVGAGRRAIEVHAPALAATDAVQFAGVWARSPEAPRTLAQRYGVQAFARYDDLLESCEAVVFAVPPAVQAELADIAAYRGRAILVERPIAGDVAGAEELAATVAARHVVSQVALAWRYSAEVRRFLTIDVPATSPAGGSGRLVSAALASGGPASQWRVERGVLRDQALDLVDLLDAALGPVVAVRAHGDPHGWLGLMLDHQVGRFSDVSLYATADVKRAHADVEIFGPGGFAAIDCAGVGPDAIETMYREFAENAERGTPHEIDVHRGLRLQRVIEAAETDLIVGI
jgi:predicted dehydrogenase